MNALAAAWSRLLFAVSHRTLRRAAPRPGEPALVDVHHKGRVVTLPGRCAHQGAPLAKGYVRGDELLCPWHGCPFPLDGRDERRSP